MIPFIRLHPADDVVIARTQLVGGTPIESVTSRGLIPPGHKIAARAAMTGHLENSHTRFSAGWSSPNEQDTNKR